MAALFSTSRLLLLAAVLAAALAMELGPLSLSNRAGLLRVSNNQNCSDQEWSCDGCRKLRHCTLVAPGVWQELPSVTCSGSSPYCWEGNTTNPAACVAEQSSCSAPKPTTDFNCVGTGYLPHPTDCNKYFVCLNGEAYAASCSGYPGSHFDAATGQCRTGIACTTARCPDLREQTYLNWPTASWIYATCTTNDINKAFFSLCPKGKAWNGADCIAPACVTEGRFQDPADKAKPPTRYYECVNLGSGKFNTPTITNCPKGTFDVDLQQCTIATPTPAPAPTP